MAKAKCIHTNQYHQLKNMTGDFLTAKWKFKLKKKFRKENNRKQWIDKSYLGGSKTIKVLSVECFGHWSLQVLVVLIHQWKHKFMIAKLCWLHFTPIVSLFIVSCDDLEMKYWSSILELVLEVESWEWMVDYCEENTCRSISLSCSVYSLQCTFINYNVFF